MKSKQLRRLQTWMIIVLSLYLLILGNFINTIINNGKCFGVVANWSQQITEQHIASGKSVQESQSDLLVEAQNFSHALQVQRDLLHIYFYANIAIIGFLGWSTFTIFLIKKEVEHDA
jgi:hypothetical protein